MPGRVAHYVERWLEVSAGFVAAHVAASRHHGVVISRDGWLNLEAFPHRPRRSLRRVRDAAPERLRPRVTAAQLELLLRAHRATLVHVHFGYAASDVVPVTRRGRPLVLSLHGHDVTGLLHDDPDRYAVVAGAVDAVIVPSRFLAAKAVAAGFPDTVIQVIPSGVDTGFFRPSPLPAGDPVVGFVGRFVEKKGLDVLLRAWPSVREAVPAARLELVGDGPLAPVVPAGEPSLTWSRPQPARRHEQVRDLLRAATVVVTPSRTAVDGDSESLLLVNLEAAASGRPVVSARHGGIPEYVEDGRTGLLVAEGDPGALADALIRVLTEPGLAGRLGAAAAEHVAQWDVRRATSRVDDLYDALLRRGVK